MKTDKNTPHAKKQKNPKLGTTITTKKSSRDEEPTVSVFTKSNAPKVIIKSENLNKGGCTFYGTNLNKHSLISIVCIIIMCLIILITFFLSLKTYNTVNELADYIML